MDMARAFLVVVLPLLLCISVPDGVFAQQGTSQSFHLITDPQVSGGVLIAQRPTQRTATELLIQGFGEVQGFFDARPWALASYQDWRRGDDAGAWFEASIQRAIVSGLAFAGVTRGHGTIAFAFDTPRTVGQTLPRLLQLVGSGGQDPTRGLNWQVRKFLDGSGQIELPDGWQITFAQKGMVAATGPQGEIERGVASPVMSRTGAARLGAMAQQLPMPVLDPTDPVSALTGVWTYAAAASRQAGRPAARILRINEAAPARLSVPGLSQAAYVDFEYERAGAVQRALALAIMGAMGPDGQWLFYQTYVSAPTQSFAQSLPVLVKIWDSALTARHVVQERLDHALANLQQAGKIWQQTMRGRDVSLQRVHDNWTEGFRGSGLIVNIGTGERRVVNLADRKEIVERLNQREPDRYRELPLSELNR